MLDNVAPSRPRYQLRTFAEDATLPLNAGKYMTPSSQTMSVAEQHPAELSGLRHHTSEGSLTCFVGFYGLNRSLRWTASSIERNILLPLREFGFDIRTAAHLNLPRDISNVRTREQTAPSSEWPSSIPLEICWLEPQHDSLSHIESGGHDLTIFGGGDSVYEYQNRRNLALQLHSLHRLWRLCSIIGSDNSDLFVLLRPDLEYIDRLDVAQIYESISKRGVDLITPEWHQWDGLNDRFAFCSARGAATYCQRLERAHEHIVERGGDFHAETFLKWAAERDALHLDICKLRAMRVRSSGKTWREDFKLDIATNLRALTRPYRHRVSSWLRL